MKPKASPTSPKVNSDHKETIEKIYKRPEHTIVKPLASRTGNTVWFMSLAAVFGVLGGVLGLLLIMAYGSDIPWLQKFDLFSNATPAQFLIKQNNSSTATNQQSAVIANEFAQSLVNYYQQKPESDDLSQAYLPSDSLGQGFILTDDGYAVALKNEIDLKSSLALSVNSSIYPVVSKIADPASGFVFLKVEASNLSTYSLVNEQDLANGQGLLAVKAIENFNTPLYAEVTVSRQGYQLDGGLGTLIRSSDFIDKKIFIQENLASSFDQSIVFTDDKKVVGILLVKDGQSYIEPFYYVKALLNNVLTAQKISRSYLGVNYVNLASLNNIPENLSQEKKQGALIYSDDEKSKPSIAAKSPAQKAGLKTGDIIISVDGQNIDAINDLNSLVLDKSVGQTITLKIFRDKSEKSIKLTLEEQK